MGTLPRTLSADRLALSGPCEQGGQSSEERCRALRGGRLGARAAPGGHAVLAQGSALAAGPVAWLPPRHGASPAPVHQPRQRHLPSRLSPEPDRSLMLLPKPPGLQEQTARRSPHASVYDRAGPG